MMLSTLLLTLAAPGGPPAAAHPLPDPPPAAQDPPAAPQDPAGDGELQVRMRLRAIINDQILTDEDVYWLARQSAGGMEPTEDQLDAVFPIAVADMLLREGWRLSGRDEAMLDRIVQRELDARIERAGSLAALSAEMAAGGGTIEDFKRFYRRMVVGYLFQSIETGQQPEKGKAVKVVIYVPPRELREYYDNHLDFYSTDHRARGRILMIPKGAEAAASRARIEEIREEIAGGSRTFLEAVEAYSDFKRALGGASGWISETMSSKAPALKEFFLNHPEGTLSEPLDLGRDWALCLVENIEEQGVTPFDEVQEEIRTELLNERFRETIQEALARTRERCYVWPAEEIDAALERRYAQLSGADQEEL